VAAHISITVSGEERAIAAPATDLRARISITRNPI
jgi:hypothetical protein